MVDGEQRLGAGVAIKRITGELRRDKGITKIKVFSIIRGAVQQMIKSIKSGLINYEADIGSKQQNHQNP